MTSTNGFSITFNDNSPIDKAIEELQNERKNERFGYIFNCGGSPAMIADAWLSDEDPIKVIEDSQREDLFNTYANDIGDPIEVIVLDFENKTIEYNSEWIIDTDRN